MLSTRFLSSVNMSSDRCSLLLFISDVMLCFIVFCLLNGFCVFGLKNCSKFNEKLYSCCDGMVQLKVFGDKCCGKVLYQSEKHECCKEITVARPPFKCCGKMIYNPSVQQCCSDHPAPLGLVNNKFNCCDQTSYNKLTQQCCSGVPQPIGISTSPLQCCIHKAYNPKYQKCCGDLVLPKSFPHCKQLHTEIEEEIDEGHEGEVTGEIEDEILHLFGG